MLMFINTVCMKNLGTYELLRWEQDVWCPVGSTKPVRPEAG